MAEHAAGLTADGGVWDEVTTQDLAASDLHPLDGIDGLASAEDHLGHLTGDHRADDLGEGASAGTLVDHFGHLAADGFLLGGLDAALGDGHGLDAEPVTVKGHNVVDPVHLGMLPAG